MDDPNVLLLLRRVDRLEWRCYLLEWMRMVLNCESIVFKISTLQEESFTWNFNYATLSDSKFAKSEFRLSLDVYKSFNHSLHN